jgi:hypothetical protein
MQHNYEEESHGPKVRWAGLAALVPSGLGGLVILPGAFLIIGDWLPG